MDCEFMPEGIGQGNLEHLETVETDVFPEYDPAQTSNVSAKPIGTAFTDQTMKEIKEQSIRNQSRRWDDDEDNENEEEAEVHAGSSSVDPALQTEYPAIEGTYASIYPTTPPRRQYNFSPPGGGGEPK